MSTSPTTPTSSSGDATSPTTGGSTGRKSKSKMRAVTQIFSKSDSRGPKGQTKQTVVKPTPVVDPVSRSVVSTRSPQVETGPVKPPPRPGSPASMRSQRPAPMPMAMEKAADSDREEEYSAAAKPRGNAAGLWKLIVTRLEKIVMMEEEYLGPTMDEYVLELTMALKEIVGKHSGGEKDEKKEEVPPPPPSPPRGPSPAVRQSPPGSPKRSPPKSPMKTSPGPVSPSGSPQMSPIPAGSPRNSPIPTGSPTSPTGSPKSPPESPKGKSKAKASKKQTIPTTGSGSTSSPTSTSSS